KELEARATQLAAAVAAGEQRVKSLTDDGARIDADLTTRRSALDEITSKLEQATKQAEETTGQLRGLEARATELTGRVSGTEARLAQLQQDTAAAETALADRRSE